MPLDDTFSLLVGVVGLAFCGLVNDVCGSLADDSCSFAGVSECPIATVGKRRRTQIRSWCLEGGTTY